MFCTSCGNEIKDEKNAKFCGACENPLKKVDASGSAKEKKISNQKENIIGNIRTAI